MDERELGSKLDELTTVLKAINCNLRRLKARGIRQWISSYYDAVAKMPDCFSAEVWEETEKLIYTAMVEEIQGDFSERGILQSGVAIKTLELFKQERKKLVEAIKARGRKG